MNTAASPKADTAPNAAGASIFAPSWYAPLQADADPGGGLPEDDPLSPRLWRNLMAARVFVAGALLALLTTVWWRGGAPVWVPVVVAVWLGLAAVTLALPRPRAPGHAAAPQWLLTVWADLAAFAALQLIAPSGLNVTPLLVWPVLLAAVAGPRLLALGSAAAGSLVLLGAAWLDARGVADTAAWVQAALSGSGLFLIALLANHLAARLVGERAAALRHQRMARLHARINRHIAGGLTEGIVVTDARAALWWANPAAARMLGVPDNDAGDPGPSAALRRAPGWPVLAGCVRGALATVDGSDDTAPHTQDLTLPLPGGGQRRLRLRIHPVATQGQLGAAVVFLDDLQVLEQRLHTERLAAMGRVSAAVAHEIRNPLAAIAQASALLLEDDAPPTQRQLLTLIEQNVRRIDRTVTDVLEAAHAPAPGAVPPAIALDATVDAILADWLRQRPQGERLLRRAGAPDARIAFDPEHLRRVLVNLLVNADRHASAAPASLRVETARDDTHIRLTVWNDGPEIPAAVRAHLFEPFATSQSRSSGLGLYLSRELCQRYHATLTYARAQRDGRWGHAFEVTCPRSS